MTGLQRFSIVPGPAFLSEAARLLVAQAGWQALYRWRVLLPDLRLAIDFRNALLQQSVHESHAFALPHFETLAGWVSSVDLSGMAMPMPDSVRLGLLYRALSERAWFDERSLWSIAEELASLFDELTSHAVRLPDDEAMLVEQLEAAYRLRGSEPLCFEARVVHELWNIANHFDEYSPAAFYRLCLAELAVQPTTPLFVVAAADNVATDNEFFDEYAKSAPVILVLPELAGQDRLSQFLHAAWPPPGEKTMSLNERAQSLSTSADTNGVLSERMALVPVHSLEEEAQAVVAQVVHWLCEDQDPARPWKIALIAQDRLSARRVRALLEREQIVCEDETGWKLITTRAAALIDTLLQVFAEGAYFSDLLDLLKAPMADCGLDFADKNRGLLYLEQRIRATGTVRGFDAFFALVAAGDADNLSEGQEGQGGRTEAQWLLQRVQQAVNRFSSVEISLSDWITCLLAAFADLQVIGHFQSDAAGKAILDLLQQRQRELENTDITFSFVQWRQWLDHELEANTFRDLEIVSPVVMTSLSAMRLRRFDAAILIGGNAENMKIGADPIFFNQGVRSELGLPTLDMAEAALRHDLTLLIHTVPRLVVTWKCEILGEKKPLASAWIQLSLLHQLACHDDLHRRPLTYATAPDLPAILPSGQHWVSVPVELFPSIISVNAYQALIDCPYRFFVRNVLGVSELEEVGETIEKRDYGETIHALLEKFHRDNPRITSLDEPAAIASLNQLSEHFFEPLHRRNPLALAWLLRWQKMIPVYIRWQRDNEQNGWYWYGAESWAEQEFELDDGTVLTVRGRIDRIDRCVRDNDTVERLIDYKMRKSDDLRREESVQLALYLLLYRSVHVADAVYLALDKETVQLVDSGYEDETKVKAQETRLRRLFSELRQGAPLPANGNERVCRYCKMDGVCRKDYWPKTDDPPKQGEI